MWPDVGATRIRPTRLEFATDLTGTVISTVRVRQLLELKGLTSVRQRPALDRARA